MKKFFVGLLYGLIFGILFFTPALAIALAYYHKMMLCALACLDFLILSLVIYSTPIEDTPKPEPPPINHSLIFLHPEKQELYLVDIKTGKAIIFHSADMQKLLSSRPRYISDN